MRTLLTMFLLLSFQPAADAAQWLGAPANGPAVHDLDRLLTEQPLGANENIKVIPVTRTAHSAHLLVQVRDREPLHYHADSDITVFLLRGRGSLQIDTITRPVTAGDVLHIPRGRVHAYINGNPLEPGVAFVVYSPPPGDNDRVLVPDTVKTQSAPASSKGR